MARRAILLVALGSVIEPTSGDSEGGISAPDDAGCSARGKLQLARAVNPPALGASPSAYVAIFILDYGHILA